MSGNNNYGVIPLFSISKYYEDQDSLELYIEIWLFVFVTGV